MMFRRAELRDADALADLWHAGWQDTHAAILPAELAKHRTHESFRERMLEHLADVRLAEDDGRPLGFSMLKGDELYQFYVAPDARGTGLATRLLVDAEQALRSRGVNDAWLACAIGNARAAKFYQKHGWKFARTVVLELPLRDGGNFPLEVWRYEKVLG